MSADEILSLGPDHGPLMKMLAKLGGVRRSAETGQWVPYTPSQEQIKEAIDWVNEKTTPVSELTDEERAECLRRHVEMIEKLRSGESAE